MDHKLMTRLAEGADTGKYEIMYHGQGPSARWALKAFKDKNAARAWAAMQGSDIHIEWPHDNPVVPDFEIFWTHSKMKGGWWNKAFKDKKAAQEWAKKQASDVKIKWPGEKWPDEK